MPAASRAETACRCRCSHQPASASLTQVHLWRACLAPRSEPAAARVACPLLLSGCASWRRQVTHTCTTTCTCARRQQTGRAAGRRGELGLQQQHTHAAVAAQLQQRGSCCQPSVRRHCPHTGLHRSRRTRTPTCCHWCLATLRRFQSAAAGSRWAHGRALCSWSWTGLASAPLASRWSARQVPAAVGVTASDGGEGKDGSHMRVSGWCRVFLSQVSGS